MRKTNKIKSMVAVAGAVAVCGSVLAVQGTSSAATRTGFRLSNFSATVTDLCVQSDVDTACSGAFAAGRSEVFQLDFNNPNTFRCSANVLGGLFNPDTRSFSRNEFKECKIVGAVNFNSLVLVRPDGSEG